MGHPPRIPVWLRWDQTIVYFVTMCVADVAPTKEQEAKLGNYSAALKRWMREELKAISWKWQLGCFDRLLRSGESLHDKWLYVQENPVRAELVQTWEDWP